MNKGNQMKIKYFVLGLMVVIFFQSCGYEERRKVESDISFKTYLEYEDLSGTKIRLNYQVTPLEHIGKNPLAFELKDLNGDNRLDLIALFPLSKNGTARVFKRTTSNNFENGEDLFEETWTATDFSIPQHLTLNDFNQDGQIDLAVVDSSNHTLKYWTGTGNATFDFQKSITIEEDPLFVTSANLQNQLSDSRPVYDLVIANYLEDKLSVLLNESKSFQDVKEIDEDDGLEPRTLQVAVGKFWGNDDFPDIAAVSLKEREINILQNVQSGESRSFELRKSIDIGELPQAVISGDWDNDGKDDLAVSNYGSDYVLIFYGDGDGGFDEHKFDTGNGPAQLAAGDLNGDNILDFVIGNIDDKDLTVLLSYGSGRGQYRRDDIASSQYERGARPSFIKIADVSGDGINDILVSLPFEKQISIFRFTSRS